MEKMLIYPNIRLRLLLLTFLTGLGGAGFYLAYKQPARISYVSFLEGTYQLYTWEGKHVMLLTDKQSLDRKVIDRILTLTDSAYRFLQQLHQREPQPYPERKKTIIAVVRHTCGIACGALGYRTIEVSTPKFERIYTQMKDSGTYDTVLFYELGRNYWFYDDQLYASESSPFVKSLRKGYAMFIRHLLVQELEVAPAAYNFDRYDIHLARSRTLFNQYIADTTMNLNRLLDTTSDGEWPGKYSRKYFSESFSAEFWASYLLHLYEDPQHGLPFLRSLFDNLRQLDIPANDQELLEQFIRACAMASPIYDDETLTNTLKWTH